MYYIYKYTNKINNKSYIGQTNNIKKRQNGHKSSANNIKDHSYNDAFHAALRKYGYNNFDFEIIEQYDNITRKELNQREQYYIRYFHTHISEHGYNLTYGDDGCHTGKKTFSQCCKQSKILNESQIIDIQEMLIQGHQYCEIKEKYPFLKDSFIQNINNGWNFKRETLQYPLLTFHSRFTKDDQYNIKASLKNGLTYQEIMDKYNISREYLSQINRGARWFDKTEIYPLRKKSNNEDMTWCKAAIEDIIFSNLTYAEIGKKYQKSLSKIQFLNNGKLGFNKLLIYPLRKNKNKNIIIWQNNFK